MGRDPRIFGVPPSLIRMGLRGIGQGALAAQLVEDLVVDDSGLRNEGWMPGITNDLEEMAYETYS